MCNFDVYVHGSTYMHVVRMYICVISNCVNAVRYIYCNFNVYLYGSMSIC